MRRLALLLSLALPCAASATVVLSETVDQLSRLAPRVVRGVVLRQEALWDERRSRISTYTELQVTEALKGKTDATLLIRQPGGTVDGVTQHVRGAARFTVGDEVLLFLEAARDEPGVWLVRGLASGKVDLEKRLGGVRAVRRLQGLTLYEARGADGKPRIRSVDREELGSADELLRRVRRAAQEQKP